MLKPGGMLVIYDILTGTSGPVRFPVPWARLRKTSSFTTPGNLRKLLAETGLKVASWVDTTDAGRQWLVALAQRVLHQGLPQLGFHLLLRSDFSVMAQNQRRNLEKGRIVLPQVVARAA